MPRSTDYSTSGRERRNSSPSSSSSSGFSTPSTTDSSGPTASSSSDISPPSSSSSTPPDAQSKQASSVELVMPGSSSHGATTFRGDTNYHQSSSSPQAPLGTGDQYSHHHNHHNRHPHPHYKAVPTPLYVDVRAGSTSDIGGIQNQVEAALYAHSSEQRRSEKTMNYALEATLRSRLAATSSGLQQLREEEVPSGGASAAMPFEKDLLSPSLSANSPLGDRAQIGKAQAELHWAGDVMGRGRSKENGENLIDAVIAHNAALRLANAQGIGTSSTNGSQRTNARGQPTPPARPPMPIATKQLPYTSLAAHGRSSVESTPRASPISIPTSSRGESSPTSARPR